MNDRLLPLVLDFAEHYFELRRELRTMKAENDALRGQNKFLVANNAQLEAELKEARG